MISILFSWGTLRPLGLGLSSQEEKVPEEGVSPSQKGLRIFFLAPLIPMPLYPFLGVVWCILGKAFDGNRMSQPHILSAK